MTRNMLLEIHPEGDIMLSGKSYDSQVMSHTGNRQLFRTIITQNRMPHGSEVLSI